jgi:hypothetical protein
MQATHIFPGRKQAMIEETTITIEFTSDTHGHLKILEHQLKHIHDVGVDLVAPRDPAAPALVAIGINKGGERGKAAAQNVAQTLYAFLHDDASPAGSKKISLVTIEGERIDIEPLPVEQIKEVIVAARQGE